MKPLVSILIPAYNSEEWIADTVESALSQTWDKKEVIVVDDGSKDETLEIAKRYASRNVRVVTQPNQGAAVARNTAFALAQGDYIQWLDADDLLDPNKVQNQLLTLEDGLSTKTLFSGAWGYFVYRKRKTRFSPTLLWADLTPVEWLIRKMANNLHMQTDNWLVSRELTEAAGPWNANLWRDNDGEYFCRVILACDGIKFVREAKSYYRAAGFKSVSYIGRSNKKLESLFLSMNLHMKYLRSLEDSDRTRSACIKYIQTWLPEFYPFRLDLAQQLVKMVGKLGGQAQEPHLSWKYDWLVKLFGWKVGRQAQLMIPKVKTSILISWDRAMCEFEGRRASAPGNRVGKPIADVPQRGQVTRLADR
jgi:glycosyltransferase involved in cell wall biosynthesis